MAMDSIVEAFRVAIPVLRSSLHKGECGRIAVLGGSKELSFISSVNFIQYLNKGTRGLLILPAWQL